MPVKPGPNSDAMALAAAWRKQQAAQQKPAIDVHHDVTATKNPPVIHPATPKPTGETPAECQGCTIHKECRTILKLWYKRAPRPELVRAWYQLIDQKARQMVCLSKMQAPQDNRFSLRREK